MIVVRGVLLDPGDAEYVAKALELLVKVLPAAGSTATPRLLAVTADLRRKTKAAAAGSVAVGPPNATEAGTCAPGRPDRPHDSHHDAPATIGTAAAARILGVTPSAVRQLAARGTLGSARPAGRWLHSTAAVVARAELKAARRRG